MARFSEGTYRLMFDAMLSEELYFSSSYASEENIKAAIKRVLGKTIKSGHILFYSNLTVEPSLDVNFIIRDPDGEDFFIKLIYGA